MKTAQVILRITADSFEALHKDILALNMHYPNRTIVSYYVSGEKHAEHPSNVSKATDAEKPDVPSWFSDNAQIGDTKPK